MMHLSRLRPRAAALLLCACASMASLAADAPGAAPATPLERNGMTNISTSAEISRYLDDIVAAVPFARKDVLGQSVQGRPIEALVFSASKIPAAERMTIMVIGSQHGAAEPAGGEALLVIARELAFGPLRPLLDEADIILLPNANPDGRDLGRRANANSVNINIDFVLAEQPETRILKEAVLRYAPEAVLDAHESAVLKRKTLARDGYLTDFEAQFEIANNPGVPQAVRDFAANDILPALLARVVAEGLPAHRYIGEITSIHQVITNGGLTLRNFRNTAGVGGTLSFLVETKLDSREDSYPTYRNIGVRLGKQLICIRAFLELAHARRTDIMTTLATPTPRRFPVFAGYVVDPSHPKVEIPMRRLDTRELETLTFPDHRRIEYADEIDLPATYLIVDALDTMRGVLDTHAIRYEAITEPMRVQVTANYFGERADITARMPVLRQETIELDAPAGALFVDLGQPRARVAALLLDPRSSSSVFRYPAYAQLMQAGKAHFVYPVVKGVSRVATGAP